MPVPVTLPRLAWGHAGARRHALLVHGLGSNAALMWRLGAALADAGWHAVAVDLRGHGTAPRTLDYTISAYAADVAAVETGRDGGWDAVIGHSLGGAATALAAAADAAWARRVVLIDPAILLTEHDRQAVRQSQLETFADPSVAAIRAANPHWHPLDVELKSLAAHQGSPWAIEQTSLQNPEWDVRAAVAALTVRTHIIGADPNVHSIFTGALADEVLTNPHVTMSVVAGAGHSPQRDRPEETVAQLLEALS